jgi:hypothetical protein
VIEVIKEVPVPVKKYVDVIYDVEVEVPIQRTFERERIVEVVIERPIEKIIEIPVEQIVEIPVEKIIEVPVENKIYVDKEYERIVEKPYDVVRENVIFSENVISIDERDLAKYPNAKVLPTDIEYVHRDQIVEKPVYVDRIVEKEVRVPFERIIEVP